MVVFMVMSESERLKPKATSVAKLLEKSQILTLLCGITCC